MSYTKKNYTDVKAKHGLHFLRDPLDMEEHGISVLEAEAGFEGMEHDHANSGQEEVYLLIEGKASIEIEGEEIELVPGDAIRVSPDSSRILRAQENSKFVISGAP